MNRRISIALVSVATTLAGCGIMQPSVHVRPALSLDGQEIAGKGIAQYDKGKQLLNEGRFAAAAQAFQAALFSGGPSIKLLNALAVSYDELGRHDLSDHYFEQALMLDPENPQTVNNLAVSLARRGAPEMAEKLLAEGHKRDPAEREIAANLHNAQTALASPVVKATTVAPPPVVTATESEVPRIEPVSPSTQELITVQSAAVTTRPTVATASHPSYLAANSARITQQVLLPPPAKKAIEAENVAATAPSESASTAVQLAANHSRSAVLEREKAALATKPPALSERSKVILAYGRLGEHIAAPTDEPEIIPLDGSVEPDQLALAKSRLGMGIVVANGAGRRWMATRMGSFLDAYGFAVARVTNAETFSHEKTIIYYRRNFLAQAKRIAQMVPNNVELRWAADLLSNIRIVLGRDLLPFDSMLSREG